MSADIELRDGDDSWPLAEPLLEAVWPPEVMATVEWRDVVFAHANQRLLAWDGSGRLVCHVGLFLREMKWGDRPVHVGGVGGVATAQDCRGRGLASRALKRAARHFADANLDFGLLFCEAHTVAYYRRRGWCRFDGTVTMEQPSGRTRLKSMMPLVLDIGLSPRAGEFDLCGLPW